MNEVRQIKHILSINLTFFRIDPAIFYHKKKGTDPESQKIRFLQWKFHDLVWLGANKFNFLKSGVKFYFPRFYSMIWIFMAMMGKIFVKMESK